MATTKKAQAEVSVPVAANVVTAVKPLPKARLTDEERVQAVIDARDRHRLAFFTAEDGTLDHFTVGEAVSLGETERYVDPSGNKGRHGFYVTNDRTKAVSIIGPMSLKFGAALGALEVPVSPKAETPTEEPASE